MPQDLTGVEDILQAEGKRHGEAERTRTLGRSIETGYFC